MIKNATIRGVSLFVEDHGIMTSFIDLDFGDGSSQGFGGWCLGKPGKPDIALAEWVDGVMQSVGVTEWKDLSGKPCRIKKGEGFNAPIDEIGHFLKDEWFAPRTLWAKR
jgi:hypothetical protein